jgi:RNA polymerase sigma-70 factor (ECF subfamily)
MTGMSGATNVTQLLQRWKGGDLAAEAELAPIIYDELHKLAQVYLRNERPGATLQPTGLVNELYLRLVDQSLPDLNSRAHFYGIAAHRMRQIVVDVARKHRADKRGGGVVNLELNEMLVYAPERAGVFVALDDALSELARFDERKTKIIELRYFGGLGQDEIARALDISVATTRREQRKAEAWLRSFMAGGDPAAGTDSSGAE